MIAQRTWWKIGAWQDGSDEDDPEFDDGRTLTEEDAADVYSSRLVNGMHAPAIDIDLPCKLVESRTPGHFHLTIDKEMTWEQYRLLLAVMADIGIVEPGYYRASVTRGQSFLRRLP